MAVHVREHRVFPGALNNMKLEMRDLIVWGLPCSGRLLIEGDFRDWPAVEAWAASIAKQLENERAHVAAANSWSSNR
jgi:menaquinone-dependent protoporphyrinogen oxidase